MAGTGCAAAEAGAAEGAGGEPVDAGWRLRRPSALAPRLRRTHGETQRHEARTTGRIVRTPGATEVEVLPREKIEPMLGSGSGLDVIHGPERYQGAYSLAVHALLDGAHVVWAYTKEHFRLETLVESPDVDTSELRGRFHLFEFPTGVDGGRYIPRTELRACMKRLRRVVAGIKADRVVCVVHSVSDLTGLRAGREDEQRVWLVLATLQKIADGAQVVMTHEAMQFENTTH